MKEQIDDSRQLEKSAIIKEVKMVLIKTMILIGKINFLVVIKEEEKVSDKKVSQNKINLQILKLTKQLSLIRLASPTLAFLLYPTKNPFKKQWNSDYSVKYYNCKKKSYISTNYIHPRISEIKYRKNRARIDRVK